jgi:hypothetical protein
LHGEGSDGKFSSCFLFFSTISNYSCRRIINEIVIPSMAQLALPQLTRGIRSRRRYPLLVSCVEKAVTVSLPLASIFPLTIPIFFLTAPFSN